MKFYTVLIVSIFLLLGSQTAFGQRGQGKQRGKAMQAKKSMVQQRKGSGKKASVKKAAAKKNGIKPKQVVKAGKKMADKLPGENAQTSQNPQTAPSAQASQGAQRAQPQSGPRLLKGLKVSGELLVQLQENEVNAFSLDEEGVLTANPGYHILFLKKRKKVVIKPEEAKLDKTMRSNVTREIAPGINLHCMGCSTCTISETQKADGGKTFACTGSCDDKGCVDFITISPSPEIEAI